ncbi:hypothetical protein KBZ15_17830 [Cyanobium sp. BA20m-p-22]|uniref:hypothetical protein n=1 Tax=Cyanobium sp. BA20m-p-22 TaxID=2823704 RepID=UPI0020CDD82B|nr:hypothetical protein [Cyanobium sp. BA20m-p-22]MCP9911747.1 hypothetical protein [Cyanobium sp. BA20m-p-22]
MPTAGGQLSLWPILQNARGRFSYHHLPLTYYTVGQELGASNDGLSFLIASPAKALCDRLVLARNMPLLSRSAMRMRQWLLDDLRLDPELLSEMDLSDVHAY